MTKLEKVKEYLKNGLKFTEIAQMLKDGGDPLSLRTLRRYAADVSKEISFNGESYDEVMQDIGEYRPFIPSTALSI